MEIGNFEELSVVLKLEHQVVAYQRLVPFRGCTTVSWCSNTFFFSFNPSLNFTKFHLNSRVYVCIPAGPGKQTTKEK